MMNTQPQESKQQMKTVYTVVDRGQNKSWWVKVGVGFVNRDGSINLRLDAMPTNGTLQVRDYEPREWERRDSDRRTAAPPLNADSLL